MDLVVIQFGDLYIQVKNNEINYAFGKSKG